MVKIKVNRKDRSSRQKRNDSGQRPCGKVKEEGSSVYIYR